MKLKRDSYLPFTVDVPGEDARLPLEIKVLNSEEGIDLRSRYREAENAKEEEKAKYWVPLLVSSFRDYVRLDLKVEKELIIERDGVKVEIDSMEKLLPFYGGEITMINTIFTAILGQAALSSYEKKVSRLRRDSRLSSEEPSPEAPGARPKTTATSAEPVDSAPSEDASAQEPIQSGSTDETKTEVPSSSFTNAPSSP